jgi:cyclic-di-AMP phosphodiesterase PgpH
VLTHAAAAATAAIAAGFIVQGILHYYERIFGIATSLTLLEWCDAGQPLLRKLAQEAPGTYSHALILSQMADEASSAIGANGLLARVGALYHDIGKTQKSHYFVENQEARMNRHDRLSPTMSLLIILGHVKDGIEMARAYGLPRVLHQFIAEHHGTTVVKYFHHAASEKAAKDSRIKGRHDQVSENEFRYPGPKPRSKESAILMICDSCEGAVRALPEPTAGRIEALIHQMVMDRLNDGQFDDCDITLRELNTVERSLVKSLCAIHHGRIKYPSKPSQPDRGRSVEAQAELVEEPVGDELPAPQTAAAAVEVARQT